MKTLSILALFTLFSTPVLASPDEAVCSTDSGQYCLSEAPGRAIPYDCDHVPPFCPQFAVVGGATCEAINTTGESFKAHSRKNQCWAEHDIVRRICAKSENPQDFKLSCHQGK